MSIERTVPGDFFDSQGVEIYDAAQTIVRAYEGGELTMEESRRLLGEMTGRYPEKFGGTNENL